MAYVLLAGQLGKPPPGEYQKQEGFCVFRLASDRPAVVGEISLEPDRPGFESWFFYLLAVVFLSLNILHRVVVK